MRFLAWLVLGCAVAASACSSDEAPGANWAIVKVEIVDGPTLSSICIDSICKGFDPADEVRNAEFSAYVETGTQFEVLRVGESANEGASGGSPVGGCMLLVLENDGATFVGGCDAPPASD